MLVLELLTLSRQETSTKLWGKPILTYASLSLPCLSVKFIIMGVTCSFVEKCSYVEWLWVLPITAIFHITLSQLLTKSSNSPSWRALLTWATLIPGHLLAWKKHTWVLRPSDAAWIHAAYTIWQVQRTFSLANVFLGGKRRKVSNPAIYCTSSLTCAMAMTWDAWKVKYKAWLPADGAAENAGPLGSEVQLEEVGY